MMSNKMQKSFRKIASLNFNRNFTSPKSTNDFSGSPVTNLAINLSELTTGRFTPKRKLSLNSCTPSPLHSNCFLESPNSTVDSPSFLYQNEQKYSNPKLSESCKFDMDNFASPLCINEKDFSNDSEERSDLVYLQSELEDANSQDSGLGLEKDKDSFQFLQPVGMPPRKVKMFDEDTCEPIKYSPGKSQRFFSPSLINKEEIEFLQSDHSPKKTARRTFSGGSNDDGFSDHLESMDIVEHSTDMSEGIKSLMEGPLSCAHVEKTSVSCDKDSLNDTPTTMLKRMNRSQSFDIRRRSSYKRDRINDENTPVISKRRKPIFNATSKFDVAPIVRYKRSHSETEAQIKSAVHKIIQNPQLIGDGSKPYCLPTISGQHKDLKSITPETLKQVLRGEYDDVIESCRIIDCRYPYEFQGGHIINGQNDYTKESIMKNFLQNPPVLKDSDKRTVLVFHCEFSSERAPKLARFLRNMDRSANNDCYPSLYYPEIYILDGGYKAFYESGTEMCEPSTYKPMLHPDHSTDLKHFRAKSKSWAGERTARTGLRQLNF